MSDQSTQITPAPPSSRTRKQEQVLVGAREVFMARGYEGATVDAIAQAARVSKVTLYRYYPDKRALFAAVIDAECEQQAERVLAIENQGGDIEERLLGLARSYTRFFLSPLAQQMSRVVMAEARHFPELGRAFWESGPELQLRRLVGFLAGACARGELEIDDLDLAAHQFAELCKADLYMRSLLGVKRRITESEIERVAGGAARTFLRAYGRA